MKEDTIMKKLEIYRNNLNEYKELLIQNKTEYETRFYENQIYNVYDKKGCKIKRNTEGFKALMEINNEYIDKQRDFIDKLLKLNVVKNNKFSNQIESLLFECVSSMEGVLEFKNNKDILLDVTYKCDFSEEYMSILLLSRFSEIDRNIVLIGGNGCGKSSLANALKGKDRDNICVIPAQKTLYFSVNDKSMLTTRKSDLEELLLENNIHKSKSKDNWEYFSFQNNQFTKLILAMREQHTEYLLECEESNKTTERDKTVYGKIRKLYEYIFPDIKLKLMSDAEECLMCQREEEKYHINALSEGEKSVLYYSISVFMAKNNSFIVVDEPETYLNPSLTNILWDYLIKERQDCQFIFITHSVDFVLGRSDSKIAWIKRFCYPNTWDFEFVEDEFNLPKALLTEILGSKKPIVFCEGDDKSSLDYIIYRYILGEHYTVIPVGGHLDVIRNCEVISSSSWMNIEVYGLVDGDNYSQEKIANLKEKKVIVLPFNEIEMFILSDEVLKYTIQTIFPMNYQNKIDNFKEQFFEVVSKNKNRVALYDVAQKVNSYIAKEKIEVIESVTSIEDNLRKISEYDVKEKYEKIIEQLTIIVDEKKYDDLLIVCNLKKEISKGLANKYLDSNYEDKAIQQIQYNGELQNVLREKYFML